MTPTFTMAELAMHPRTESWKPATETAGVDPSTIMAKLEHARRLIDALALVGRGTEAYGALVDDIWRELATVEHGLARLRS